MVHESNLVAVLNLPGELKHPKSHSFARVLSRDIPGCTLEVQFDDGIRRTFRDRNGIGAIRTFYRYNDKIGRVLDELRPGKGPEAFVRYCISIGMEEEEIGKKYEKLFGEQMNPAGILNRYLHLYPKS